MGRFGALIGLLGVAGCDQLGATSESILPVQLSLLVEQVDGTPLSVVVDLRRNSRQQLDVRVSRGQRFFDGVHLWEMFAVRNEDAFSYRMQDLLTHTSRDLPMRMSTAPDLLGIDHNQVWVGQGDRIFDCRFARWSCTPVSEVGPFPYEHQGPGRGFHVRLEGAQVLLTLPMDATSAGEPILDGVRRVLGLHWIRERFLQSDPVLNRMFRGRADLTAPELDVVVDGDLEEWTASDPVVVDAAWQIEAGAPSWSGVQDASFSVAAARSGENTCFAGRVRDDHFVEGDAVHIRLGERDVLVPLVGAPSDWFGVRFEQCVPFVLGTTSVPFGVLLQDQDPGEAPTRLSTSPELLGLPTGTLRPG